MDIFISGRSLLNQVAVFIAFSRVPSITLILFVSVLYSARTLNGIDHPSVMTSWPIVE